MFSHYDFVKLSFGVAYSFNFVLIIFLVVLGLHQTYMYYICMNDWAYHRMIDSQTMASSNLHMLCTHVALKIYTT